MSRLQYPIYKDDYEIIRDEMRSNTILNCGTYAVRQGLKKYKKEWQNYYNTLN